MGQIKKYLEDKFGRFDNLDVNLKEKLKVYVFSLSNQVDSDVKKKKIEYIGRGRIDLRLK